MLFFYQGPLSYMPYPNGEIVKGFAAKTVTPHVLSSWYALDFICASSLGTYLRLCVGKARGHLPDGGSAKPAIDNRPGRFPVPESPGGKTVLTQVDMVSRDGSR